MVLLNLCYYVLQYVKKSENLHLYEYKSTRNGIHTYMIHSYFNLLIYATVILFLLVPPTEDFVIPNSTPLKPPLLLSL